MPRKRRTPQPPAGQPALAALTSPVRIELIGAARDLGPCSIRELAARLGRPADGLYHHVRTLLRTGVFVQADTRKVGRRTEAVYALAGPRVAGALDPASPASAEAVTKAAAAALRLAAREFASAVAAGDVTCTGGVPNALVQRQTAWLTDEALAELKELLARVERFLSDCAQARRGRTYSLTLALVPTAHRRSPRADSD